MNLLPNYAITDLEAVVADLLANNPTTTTLDVKMALRDKGFFAEQGAVSKDMDSLVQLGQVEWMESALGFRLYCLPGSHTATPVSQPTPVVQSTVKTSKPNDLLTRLRNMLPGS